MDDTTETPSAGADLGPPPSQALSVPAPLGPLESAWAGLHAGMLGALWMLLWLGIDSAFSRRGFWGPENLFASAFYGGDALTARFGAKTMSGLALWLIVYSLLGSVFAFFVRDRLRARRRILAAVLFSLVWFYAAFHGFWKTAMPLVYLLYPESPMVVGHLIYGLVLAGFPTYFNHPRHLPAPPPGIPQNPSHTNHPEAL